MRPAPCVCFTLRSWLTVQGIYPGANNLFTPVVPGPARSDSTSASLVRQGDRAAAKLTRQTAAFNVRKRLELAQITRDRHGLAASERDAVRRATADAADARLKLDSLDRQRATSSSSSRASSRSPSPRRRSTATTWPSSMRSGVGCTTISSS